jgi:hypothetical protein
MITIEYSPDGIAVADHKAEEFVRDLIAKDKALISAGSFRNDIETSVSTENVITIARVLKKQDGIEVQFKYKDEILVPDKDGRLEHWPDGFSDFWDKCLRDLL